MPWPYPAGHVLTADEYDGDTSTPTLSLTASWTGTLQYRKVGMPPNGVQLKSGTLTAGTKANATVIGTLPVGYRPTAQVSIPIVTDVQAAGLSPHIDIATNGAISIQGVTGCTVIIINGLFSTDL